MKLKKNTQYGFYMLSMAMFFVVALILGTDIPVCFDEGAEFIGIGQCFTTLGIVIPIICMIAFGYIWSFVCSLKRRIEGTKLGPIKVMSAENINNDVMVFVGSYFLPIVSFNIAESWRHFWVLSILFVLIGVIYVRANIYYTNPTLLIFGYRVYKIKGYLLDKELNCVIIMRGSLKVDDQIMYIPIDDDTFFGMKKITVYDQRRTHGQSELH